MRLLTRLLRARWREMRLSTPRPRPTASNQNIALTLRGDSLKKCPDQLYAGVSDCLANRALLKGQKIAIPSNRCDTQEAVNQQDPLGRLS